MTVPILLGMAWVVGVISGGTAIRGGNVARVIPGAMTLALLGCLAYLLAAQKLVNHPNLEYPLWALDVGLVAGNAVGLPRWLEPALQGEFLIKTGLVVFGAEVLFSRLLEPGLPGLLTSWVAMPAFIRWAGIAPLVVLPRVGRHPPIDRHLRAMDESDVNPAAMVYTEFERLPPARYRPRASFGSGPEPTPRRVRPPTFGAPRSCLPAPVRRIVTRLTDVTTAVVSIRQSGRANAGRTLLHEEPQLGSVMSQRVSSRLGCSTMWRRLPWPTPLFRNDCHPVMESLMVRKQATVVLVLAAFVASTFVGTAQAAGFLNSRSAAGGLLARLNKPIVPGMPTLPGMPTASPLGLIAPRLSNAVLIFQKGGLKTPAGRLSGLGVVSPRISPVAALISTPPKTRQAQMLYGLTILSPRAAVLVAMLKGARGLAAGVR